MEKNIIHNQNCLEGLRLLPDESIDCCVTSPPYYGLRDYGAEGQIGLEETPDKYADRLIEVFAEVKRVLKPEGTLWLNLGDSYAAKGRNRTLDQATAKSGLNGGLKTQTAVLFQPNKVTEGLKAKDLIGVPWMVAFALRANGWYLRQDIIWAKKNVMPESVTDRCTKSHEYIFMFSKSPKYYYDQDAIKEPAIYDIDGTGTMARKQRQKADNKVQPDQRQNGIRKAGCKDNQVYKQIGNAVAVPVGQWIGEKVMDYFNK